MKKPQTKQQKRTYVIVGRFHNNPKKLNHTREIRTRSQKEKIIKYTHNNKDWKSLVGDKVPHYENCFWKECVKESVSVSVCKGRQEMVEEESEDCCDWLHLL